SSNVGRLKATYRNGLSLRYGRMMQAISGVHFNYSFPAHLWEAFAHGERAKAADSAFVSESYFAALRNYRRFGWLILYLFGTSPAVSRGFLAGRDHDLRPLDADTLFEPYATSLRMSDIGYRNKNQAEVNVSVNSLRDYARDLNRAIRTPFPAYEKIGVKVGGAHRQLSANILQVGNEYYSFIRPKRVALPGERPTHALERGGVEYLEVRALDVSAFDPVGVNQDTLRFVEAFLALCLLRDSPPIERDEQRLLDRNHVTVARRGREPALRLNGDGGDRPMLEWAGELLDDMQGVCEMLDHGEPSRPYRGSLARQREKIEDPAITPSARLLAEMRDAGETFFELALRMSRVHKEYFLGLYPPNESRLAEFATAAEESHAQQRRIEAGDKDDFDAYLARYLAD
ncbi:MAG TPA: glutamate--cysteine ligase, partial [Steroidobacteraceae bacterium]|nr:glutamate--cysteine ligase [Steroidobacteraceae bacterium]